MSGDLEGAIERLRAHDIEIEAGDTDVNFWPSKDINAVLSELCARKWQPIETAPRDGRPVLAWDPYYLMRCARFDPSSGSWLTDLPHGFERGEREMRIEPTHWMPLPPAPEPPPT